MFFGLSSGPSLRFLQAIPAEGRFRLDRVKIAAVIGWRSVVNAQKNK